MEAQQLMEIGFHRVGHCSASLFDANQFEVNLVSSVRSVARLVYAISLDNVVYVRSTSGAGAAPQISPATRLAGDSGSYMDESS